MNPRDLIECIAKALWIIQSRSRLLKLIERGLSVIELSVAREDIGQVIGKQGKTVMAMRAILGIASEKLKKHFVLEIIE